MSCDYLYKSKDYGLYDCCPQPSAMLNTKMCESTCHSTYYFSYAEGIRKTKVMNQREILAEPKITSEMGAGFDLNAFDNLSFHEDPLSVTSLRR
jgi:hypothetical protein